MKIVRIRTHDEEIAYGGVEEEGIRVHLGTPFVAWEPTETLVPFGEARLLAPVFPTKVIGVGRNYADHAAELDNQLPDEPLIFLKPATAVVGPGQPIVLPPDSHEVHHEAELAVVVGTVDNFLRPKLVGADTKMPDLLILLSTFGGLSMFGAVGLVLGPIIAALFIAVWQIYGEAFGELLGAEAAATAADPRAADADGPKDSASA